MIKPSHVGLCTQDLDATLRFFVDGLGFEAADGWDLDSEALPDLPAALEVEVETDRSLTSMQTRVAWVDREQNAHEAYHDTGIPAEDLEEQGEKLDQKFASLCDFASVDAAQFRSVVAQLTR